MLKRFFHVPRSFTAPSGAGSRVVGSAMPSTPQPIEDADKQRLVKLSGTPSKAEGQICVSGWSSGHNSVLNHRTSAQSNHRANHQPHHWVTHPAAHPASRAKAANSRPFLPSITTAIEANLDPLSLSGTVSKEEGQINQLKQYIRQQQRLQSVERKLRRTLSFSTIVGTTVVETAALFNARQVSLLRFDETHQSCQQVVRYCQDQRLAWQSSVYLPHSEFPNMLQQLREGKTLCISPSQPPMNAAMPIPNLEAAPSAEATQSTAELASARAADKRAANKVTANDLSASDPAAGERRQWLSRWSGNWLLVPVRHQAHSVSIAAGDGSGAQATAHDYWGVMALSLPDREVWTQEAVLAVHSITAELALAIQKSQQYQAIAQANQELQKLALSDGLTSLANRRRFDEHLADEWQRLARDRQPLSLILCDLDHFKRYNDTFGHPAGDRCLIRVARALLNGPQRPADLVARYGGEEFAIILPNTDTHGAWRIAQKIHDSIRALQIDHAPDNEEPYVTVTMGVSTIIPGHQNTAQMLVQASDLALYHAKQHGRNRTYVNGHYNTVSPKAVDSHADQDAGLDVMPTEPDP